MEQKILYRGKWYQIRLNRDTNRRRMRVELEEDIMVLHTPGIDEAFLREGLEGWYMKQAHMIFLVRVMHYQQITGGRVNQIHIRDQKTRWGSCSSLHNLNFNWRLVMAPPEVLDYVVVHELCHLSHMNHSREFWEMVGSVMPEYPERKKWLKENGELLKLPAYNMNTLCQPDSAVGQK